MSFVSIFSAVGCWWCTQMVNFDRENPISISNPGLDLMMARIHSIEFAFLMKLIKNYWFFRLVSFSINFENRNKWWSKWKGNIIFQIESNWIAREIQVVLSRKTAASFSVFFWLIDFRLWCCYYHHTNGTDPILSLSFEVGEKELHRTMDGIKFEWNEPHQQGYDGKLS